MTARGLSEQPYQIEFAACQHGTTEFNEDCIGSAGPCAWVIDGATDLFQLGLTGSNTDVRFAVQYLNEGLIRHAADPVSLGEILNRAVLETAAAFSAAAPGWQEHEEYELPHFAIALVRISRQIETLILGDCCAGIRTPAGTVWLTDHKIDRFNRHNRAALKGLMASGNWQPSQELKIYQETRKYANTAAGYWIGSLTGKGLAHARQMVGELPPGSRILLCSDGFSAYFSLPDAVQPAEFAFTAESINQACQRIADSFRQDSSRTCYVREKKMDDQSVLLLRVLKAQTA